jgi:ribosomal protein S12 methylthiotransferase
MYAYPSTFTDEMIDAIASLPNVLPYIDIPLQHINDRVLTSMRRRTSRKLIDALLGKLRDRVPGLAIRTTFITGFPGETDAEHAELLDFIRRFRFANLGVFCYSPEPGTPAARLHETGGAIPEDVMEARREELMLAQQEIVFAHNAELAEKRVELDVLIEGEAELEPQAASRKSQPAPTYIGRSYAQAPEVDTITLVHSRHELAPGELVRCVITGSHDYDLVAAPTADLSTDISLPVR